MTAIKPNACHITVKKWGNESSIVIVVDQFLAEPERWRDHAFSDHHFVIDRKDLYPGKRSIASIEYQQVVKQTFTEQVLPHVVAFRESKTQPHDLGNPHVVFSIAAARESNMLPIQRIPHFDSLADYQWAMVHYLFKQPLGGTGFYRHNRSGFESITNDRKAKYFRMLQDDMAEFGPPDTAFITESTDTFTRVDKVEAVFNRAIFYPSNVLHSGQLSVDISPDQNKPRLTGNALFDLRSISV